MIDWPAIERLMLKSFRGLSMTDYERLQIERAYRAEPLEYGARHRKIKYAEIEKLRMR